MRRAKAALQVAEGPGFVQLEIFRLGPGSSFGDTAVLAGAARRASVVANTHVEALVLSRVDLVTKLPEGALAQLTKRAEVGLMTLACAVLGWAGLCCCITPALGRTRWNEQRWLSSRAPAGHGCG